MSTFLFLFFDFLSFPVASSFESAVAILQPSIVSDCPPGHRLPPLKAPSEVGIHPPWEVCDAQSLQHLLSKYSRSGALISGEQSPDVRKYLQQFRDGNEHIS